MMSQVITSSPKLEDMEIAENKILNKDRKKKRKVQSIKEKTYPKINIYNPWGRVIGSIRQGESINYQKLLLKKGR